jgi:hypothetical protein
MPDVDPSGWPVVAGRRLVPVSEPEKIRAALAVDRRGKEHPRQPAVASA